MGSYIQWQIPVWIGPMPTRWNDPPEAFIVAFSTAFAGAELAFHSLCSIESGLATDLVYYKIKVAHDAFSLFLCQFRLKFFT